MNIINSKKELERLLTVNPQINVYGAGAVFEKCITAFITLGYNYNILNNIYVTSLENNPSEIKGIKIKEYNKDEYEYQCIMLLAVGKKYLSELNLKLEKDNVITFCISDDAIAEIAYYDTYKTMQEFISKYATIKSRYNVPVSDGEKYAWTCWWQGEENAPDIVKACLNSQRMNLPADVKNIIITEKNYKNYIDIPDYIIDKVNKGYITITTLSDIIRASLLYKYGGIWIDSTVLVHKKMPIEYWDYNIFSAKGLDYHFSSYSHLSLWFLGGKNGNQLFRFVMEAFYYYYKKYDFIKYYLTVDYFLAIAINSIDEVKKDVQNIPINNEKGDMLGLFLADQYCFETFEKYTDNTCIQKLTRKLERYGKKLINKDNFYHMILNKYILSDH